NRFLVELLKGGASQWNDSGAFESLRCQVYRLTCERPEFQFLHFNLSSDGGQSLTRMFRGISGRLERASAQGLFNRVTCVIPEPRQRIHRHHAPEDPRRGNESEYQSQDRMPTLLSGLRNAIAHPETGIFSTASTSTRRPRCRAGSSRSRSRCPRNYRIPH